MVVDSAGHLYPPFLIPHPLFCITVPVEIIADRVCSHIRMDELIKDKPHHLSFLKINDQSAVL